jgi:ComF family protein
VSLILDLIFPINCCSCGQNGQYLCSTCFSKIKSLEVKGNSLSLFKYHSHLKKIISLYKYSFVTDILPDLSAQISHRLKSDYPNLVHFWQTHHYVLTPIPLHFLRQNWRGFNQSALLSQKIAKNLGLSYSDSFLRRTQNRPPQAKLKDRSRRLLNLSQPFSLVSPPPPHLILFDDVKTTSATLNSAANTIKAQFPQTDIFYLTLAG